MNTNSIDILKTMITDYLKQKIKTMTQINFGGTIETVITRAEFTLDQARKALQNESIAILGYGVQGPGQSLNLKDNGFNVIIGQRKGTDSWKKAQKDGWKEGINLFEPDEACFKASLISNLLSDAGQISNWPVVNKHLTKGKTLCFSHGFGITFSEKTGIIPPKDIDVILVAPKGSGTSVRRLFLQGKGINSSYAIHQDYSGKAKEKVLAMGIGIGSGYLFETSFEKEVYSDLTGERGVLMGALTGIMEAQYNVLRRNGHSPSEAFNETVEELTQSLMPLVAENGMDWMYANTSTTAQRGALDWRHRFRDAVEPVFNELYNSVISGKEAEIVIKANSKNNYKAQLEEELNGIRDSEMWQSGLQVRKLRS